MPAKAARFSFYCNYIKDPSELESGEAYGLVQESLFPFENASLEAVDSFRYNLIHIINKTLLTLNLSWFSKEYHFNYLLLQAETYDKFKNQACDIFEKIRGTYRETRQQ